jgi:hypothetical protein
LPLTTGPVDSLPAVSSKDPVVAPKEERSIGRMVAVKS